MGTVGFPHEVAQFFKGEDFSDICNEITRNGCADLARRVDMVHLVFLVSLVQANKPDRPNRLNEQDRWWPVSAPC